MWSSVDYSSDLSLFPGCVDGPERAENRGRERVGGEERRRGRGRETKKFFFVSTASGWEGWLGKGKGEEEERKEKKNERKEKKR